MLNEAFTATPVEGTTLAVDIPVAVGMVDMAATAGGAGEGLRGSSSCEKTLPNTDNSDLLFRVAVKF